MILVSVDDGTNWTTHPQAIGTTFRGIGFGNGLFVAVGNKLMTSSDGTNWTIRTTGITNVLNDITYGNGTFVAVGAGGSILTSTDGQTWIDQSASVSSSLYLSSISFGNGLFVGCANTSPEFSVITSPDGISWSTTPGTASYPKSVAFGNGRFIIAGSSSATSTNGMSWSSVNEGLTGVCFGNGQFVGVDLGGTIMNSTNGVQWTWITSNYGATYSDLYSVTFGNDTYVAGGIGGLLRSSSNVTNWVTRSQSQTDLGGLYGATYADGKFVIVGTGGISDSPIMIWNGSVWNLSHPLVYDALMNVSYAQGQFHVVSSYGLVTSTNGSFWNYLSTSSSSQNSALSYGMDTYVLVGSGGVIRTSTNLVDWVQRTSGTTRRLFDVTFGNGRFVAVGGDSTSPSVGVTLASVDGINWTNRSSGSLTAVTYHDGLYVAAGLAGLIRTSTNGVNWTTRNAVTANTLLDVTWGHGVFMAVGAKGTMLTSRDGITWSNRSAGIAHDLYAVAVGPESFMVAGGQSSVFESDPLVPKLKAIGFSPVAGFQFQLSSPTGGTHRIECSTNLVTWEDFGVVTNQAALNPIQDASATNLTKRFYRLSTP